MEVLAVGFFPDSKASVCRDDFALQLSSSQTHKDPISNETCTVESFFSLSLLHIHLQIHAHCISICFPPITSITQSRRPTQHIFHLSLFSLSFINLNIPTPAQHFTANTTEQGKRGRSLICVIAFILSLLTAPWGVKEGNTSQQYSIGPSPGVSLSQGSLGEWVPVEVCLNARGSVCPGLVSPSLMDVSALLIVRRQEKICISFFMNSLCGSWPLVTSYCPCRWSLRAGANSLGMKQMLDCEMHLSSRHLWKTNPHFELQRVALRQ